MNETNGSRRGLVPTTIIAMWLGKLLFDLKKTHSPQIRQAADRGAVARYYQDPNN